MFGPDTALVWDAIQIAGIAAVAGAGAVWWVLRRRKTVAESPPPAATKGQDLESRVRVLERIATDRSIDLADEIEALREGESR